MLCKYARTTIATTFSIMTTSIKDLIETTFRIMTSGCRGYNILSVAFIIFMLSALMLNVVMLSVVAPLLLLSQLSTLIKLDRSFMFQFLDVFQTPSLLKVFLTP